MTKTIVDVMTCSPVIPVIVIKQPDHALPLARALVAGGLKVLEVTLRTAYGLDAIRAIANDLPNAIVGAGTVTEVEQVDAVIEAGGQFLVSPGSTQKLIEAALQKEITLLPGVATPSEAMVLLEYGVQHMKFFPAEAAGGIPMLKSIHGPLPQITFCPTGGITSETAKDYLALPNVACVGGSWMVPQQLIDAGDWGAIEALAAETAALSPNTGS
ncbi:MAG: bifunctional 4-hydroxy-2-oxoglutarate aldolase/2-dehydro-3-deoxy-phosphogluconate aldolase [Pseudomonadales bacterium]